MNIVFSKRFEKHYRKRIKSNRALVAKFNERLELFIAHPQHPSLRLHQLKGNQSTFYSFSVTGDVRAILTIENSTVIFHDIGTHNQVY